MSVDRPLLEVVHLVGLVGVVHVVPGVAVGEPETLLSLPLVLVHQTLTGSGHRQDGRADGGRPRWWSRSS